MKWTQDEIEFIRSSVTNLTVIEIAGELNRSVSSVQGKCQKLKIHVPYSRHGVRYEGTSGRDCTMCGDFKEWKYFYSGNSANGKDSRCATCSNLRTTSHLHRHGITVEEYNWLYQQQGGVCCLCKEPETSHYNNGKLRKLSVDHDHNCTEHAVTRTCKLCIRGLLCNSCNRGLGLFESKEHTKILFQEYLSSRPFLRMM